MKQTEVGLIPDDWKVEQLNEYFEVGSSKRVFQSQWRKAGIPFYRAREIVILSEKNTVENELFIDESLYNQFKTLYGVPSVNDLLVTGVGTLGKVYKVQDTKPFYFKDGNIICLKNKGLIDSDYVKYHFDYSIVKNQINDNSGKSTVGTYTINSARKTLIPIPPLAEQHRIAKTLSDIDTVINTTEKLIQKKKNIKQGAMQSLLTGKKRLPGFAATSKLKQTELGEIPEDWEVKKIKDFAKVYDGTHQTPHYVDVGIPFYSVENITANDFEHTKLISEEEHRVLTSKVKIEKGDILMTRIGSIGDCKYVDWEPNASFYVSLALIKCDKSVDAKFVSYYSNSLQFKKELELRSLITAIPQKINLGPISEIVLFMPSKEEQTAIANVLSSMDKEIESLNTKLEKYRNLKTAMMQQLLTGKIRLY